MNLAKWSILALAGVLLSTSEADAFGRRGRRGCNGGNGCHGSYYNGCHGSYYSGCHGSYNGGRVIYSGGCHGSYSGGRVIYSGGCHGSVLHGGGCHGSGTVYYGGHGSVYSGGRYTIQRDSHYTEPRGERVVAPERRDSDLRDGERRDSDRRDDEVRNSGTIEFRAPRDAQVWVDGQMIERSGDNWRWTSPALQSGARNFEVRARWNEDGRVVNRSRTVSVQPGGRMTVDFTRD